MSRPWMPLHVADYLRDTRRLTAAQHGAYLLLIMEYWTVGNLPMDDASLARIACMLPNEWKRERATIAAFFTSEWRHKRIDKELARAADISSKRRAAAEQMHSKKDAIAEQEQSTSTHTRDVIVSSLPSLESSLELSEPQREQACGKFDQFWSLYPNKVGKKAARKKFDIALKAIDFETLMVALRAYVSKTDDRPWCNPETWLNQGRWDDEPAQQQRGGALGALDRIESELESTLDREAGQGSVVRLPAR